MFIRFVEDYRMDPMMVFLRTLDYKFKFIRAKPNAMTIELIASDN